MLILSAYCMESDYYDVEKVFVEKMAGLETE